MPPLTNFFESQPVDKWHISPRNMDAWFSVVMEILNVVSLAGNGGVVLLTAMRWRRRRGNNWFVLSLAATDFLFSSLLMPELSEIHRGAGVSYNMCSFALWGMTAALIANACVLSLERCVASSHSSRNAARPTVMPTCAPGRISLFLGATIMKLILLAKLASPDWKAPASPALDFTFPSIIACEVLIRCIVPFLFVYEWAPHTNASQEQLLLEASPELPKRTAETQVRTKSYFPTLSNLRGLSCLMEEKSNLKFPASRVSAHSSRGSYWLKCARFPPTTSQWTPSWYTVWSLLPKCSTRRRWALCSYARSPIH